MTDHWKGCWRYHPACAMARVVELEAEVKRLTVSRETQSAGCCTHQCYIPCAEAHDDPPGTEL